jgi:hypothetical protein
MTRLKTTDAQFTGHAGPIGQVEKLRSSDKAHFANKSVRLDGGIPKAVTVSPPATRQCNLIRL